MTFLWYPGEGCDEGALARLAAAFPLPKQPMGEAWFIGGTRCLYTELQGGLAELSARDIEPALEAIASGTSSFGALEEWQVWFHYLLPRVLPRCHETFLSFGGSALLDALVTAFITQYPAGMLETPYPVFRADVLSTLGRAIMDKVCWPDGDIDVRRCLGKYYNSRIALWHWFDVGEPLSASLFFCLKYLAAEEVGPWLASVLAIPSPHWRGQVIAWLVGAHPLLTGAMAQPNRTASGRPGIHWFWSHCLDGHYSGDYSGQAVTAEFIPPRNRQLAVAAVADLVTGDTFADWLASLSTDPALEQEMADLPFEVHALYAGG